MAIKDFRNRVADAATKTVDRAKQSGAQAAAKASELSAQAAVAAKDAAANVAEKASEEQTKRMLKKYAPVLADELHADDFRMPSVIEIVEEGDRKDVEVCEGAIGWLTKEASLEILHLYKEAIEDSGVQFHPMAKLGETYLIDQVEGDRYVDLSCVFENTQKEKVTELSAAAYLLGAKHCRIELVESNSESIESSKGVASGIKGAVKGLPVSLGAKNDVKSSSSKSSDLHILFDKTYEGNAKPQVPELRWFKNDTEVQQLITERCVSDGSRNVVKEYNIVLKGSSSSTMSESMAKSLDSALGGKKSLGMNGGKKISNAASKERSSSLVFHIEF